MECQEEIGDSGYLRDPRAKVKPEVVTWARADSEAAVAALKWILRAPRLEKALERTLMDPGLEQALEWALKIPERTLRARGLERAFEWTLKGS